MSFRDLHVPGAPLLIPNPWDAGSARLLAHLGFRALATTSSGSAATLGLADGTLTREQALAHAATIAAATGLPVSADLENGFADDPAGVASCVDAAVVIGLAGCSIEDSYRPDARAAGSPDVYDPAFAAERVAAAVEAAAGRLVLTARAENYLYGRRDLADTIARLQAYQEAGADVLYAPGLTDPGEIRSLVTSVDRPVNVLAIPAGPTVPELADLGVARISVGGSFAFAAYGALLDAAHELLDQGTYGYAARSTANRKTISEAFGSRPPKPARNRNSHMPPNKIESG